MSAALAAPRGDYGPVVAKRKFLGWKLTKRVGNAVPGTVTKSNIERATDAKYFNFRYSRSRQTA